MKLLHKTISLLLAALLLVVAGARSSYDYTGAFHSHSTPSKEVSKAFPKQSQSADTKDAKVSTLALDAVITPAISFDFSHYFYFLPQPAWHFVVREAVTLFSFQESFFLVSYFHKVFGRFIVTNAP